MFRESPLRSCNDVLPANVASEPFKFLRYDERFKDYAELENEFKFDDDHKVTVIKEVQVHCALFLILIAFSVIVCKLIRKLIIPWNFDHNLLSSSTGVSFVLPYIKSSQSHLSGSMQFKHLSKPEGIVRAIII